MRKTIELVPGRAIIRLTPPIRPEDLAPLPARCRTVQFSETLDDAELISVAGLLERHPEVTLRVYGHGLRTPYSDLEFLAHFPAVSNVAIEIHGLDDLSGLRLLRPDLQKLSLGQTKKRLSLAPLERFTALQNLWLYGHVKHIEVLSTLSRLRRLSLRGMTLANLDLLKRLADLEIFEIKLGGTRDLSALPEIGRLRYLELFLVRGLAAIDAVAQIPTLEYVWLQAQKQVTRLPSFRPARALRRAHLHTMKGLRDLAPLADAPRLESLVAFEMTHLTPEAFRPFRGHPTLREASIGLGSQKKNAAVQELLGLPPVSGPPAWLDL